MTRREYRKISATRQCGSIGTGGCNAFMKRWVSSSRCASCPAKGAPARAGSQPGAGASNDPSAAEAGARVGHGVCGPATSHLPGGPRSCFTGRQAWLLRVGGEESAIAGGGCDQGPDAEDGPVPWEALASPRAMPVWRRAGAPSPPHDTGRAPVSSALQAQNQRPQRGRPPARGTGAVAEGGRESEGGRGARTSGNGVTPGPGRAQAARVDVIL